jgi:hypothetical protein
LEELVSVDAECDLRLHEDYSENKYTLIFQKGFTELSNNFPKLRRVYLSWGNKIDIWVLSETWEIGKQDYPTRDWYPDKTVAMILGGEIPE